MAENSQEPIAAMSQQAFQHQDLIKVSAFQTFGSSFQTSSPLSTAPDCRGNYSKQRIARIDEVNTSSNLLEKYEFNPPVAYQHPQCSF